MCFEVYTKVIPPEANKGSKRQLIKILLSFLSRSGRLLLSNKKDSLELAKFKVIVCQSLGELVYVFKHSVFKGAIENFRQVRPPYLWRLGSAQPLLPSLSIPPNQDKTNLQFLPTTVPQLTKCTFSLVNHRDHSQESG